MVVNSFLRIFIRLVLVVGTNSFFEILVMNELDFGRKELSGYSFDNSIIPIVFLISPFTITYSILFPSTSNIHLQIKISRHIHSQANYALSIRQYESNKNSPFDFFCVQR